MVHPASNTCFARRRRGIKLFHCSAGRIPLTDGEVAEGKKHHATVCNTVNVGSNPTFASNHR
jgi:hypothetical protein